MTELCDLTALELRDAIAYRRLSPVEVLEACLDRIEAVNPAVNAMVTLDVEGARKAAVEAEAAVDARRCAGSAPRPPSGG